MERGRPLKYKTNKALQTQIDAYFDSCFMPMLNKDGDIVEDRDGKPIMTQVKPFTMAGLAAYLEIDRRTLLNYSNKDEFFPTIKKARARIEAYAEEQLYTPKVAAGVIFNLKNNFGWNDSGKDKDDTDNEIKITLDWKRD